MQGQSSSPLHAVLPRTIVLGNGPISKEDEYLLQTSSQLSGSTIFTSNMAFKNELTRLPWHRKIAVVQDYLYQELQNSSEPEDFLALSHHYDEVFVIESLYEGVQYGNFDFSKFKFLTHLRRVRLLNRVAGARLFRLDEEHLPSAGIIALALAIDLMKGRPSTKSVGLAGITLSSERVYALQIPSPDRFAKLYGGQIDGSGLEVTLQYRNHFRPDALAIAAFSYKCTITSACVEISSLTTTWPEKTKRSAKGDQTKDSRPLRWRDLIESGFARRRRAGWSSLFRLLWRQTRYPFRIRRP